MPIPNGLREFDDASSARANIYTGVLDAVGKRFPIEDDDWRVELLNPRYDGKQNFTLSEQKHALLNQRSLATPIVGTWRLTNKKTGAVETRDDTVMQVPFYSNRGTIINNGSEYSTINQARLRPGVYVRRKRTGEIETQFNVESGKGRGFRLSLEPTTGVFKVNVAQSSIPAYPLLTTMGLTDADLEKAWGKELLDVNRQARSQGSVPKLYSRLAGYAADANIDEQGMGKYIRDSLPTYAIDPDVTLRTLGLKDKRGIDSDVLRRATEKMLAVANNAEDQDDRDAPEFKDYLGVEDLLRERVDRDAGKITKSMLQRIRRSRSLKSIPRSALTPYMNSFILGSGLAMPLEESNPLHYLEQMNRVTGFGEGGIGSTSAVTDDARELNPNQLGFLDIVSGPENERIGVDARVSYGAYKGNDKKIYGEFLDIKTGKPVYLRPDQTAALTLGFPTALTSKSKYVSAIRHGKTVKVPKSEIDIVLPSLSRQFSQGVNLNAMPTAMQAGRQFYASKFWTQFLPLKESEAPLIDSLMPDGKTTFSEYYGRKSGTLNAEVDGLVKKVNDDKIVITDAAGKDTEIETVKNFPFNRLSGISYTAVVKPGDKVSKGQMLAHSNFTDPKTGAINLGRNLRTCIIPARGWSNDDSIVISESAAQKLATSRLYGFDLDAKHGVELGRDKYAALFPSKFTKEQFSTLDDFGIVKPGTVLNKGDPILVAVGPKLLTAADAQLGRLHKTLRNTFTDKAVIWEHPYPGTVTDSTSIRNGRAGAVNVKAEPPVKVGDKLSTGMAVKGTVGKVVSDDQMPRNAATNEPYEFMINPAAILSRVSPNQIIWMALAKVAKKNGQQLRIPQERPEGGWANWGAKILAENGIDYRSDIFDPESGKTVKSIGDGYAYVHSFHHLSEKKLSARGGGGSYDINQQPAKGGYGGAKRFSGLDVGAALSHGATAVLKDVFQIRGTKNENFWKALRSGQPLPEVGQPFVYTKFLNTLKAGGINIDDRGGKLKLLPMSDQGVLDTGAKEIKSSEMLDYDFNPRPGGLFDQGLTGGTEGNKWTYVKLDDPVPNPVMEEPIRRVLGLTGKQLRNILAGTETINGKTGGAALKSELAGIDVDAKIQELKRTIKTSRGNARDNAVKSVGYLDAMKKQNLTPDQWMVTKIPVIPPVFRPISRMGDMGLVADLNELYKDLIETKSGVSQLRGQVDEADLAEDKLNIYDAVKAVYGLGDPITSEGQSKRLKGAIWQITGDTPKCYDSETELLTVSGWKPFTEVGLDDVVGTINPDTLAFEWQSPSEATHAPYIGPMVHTLTKKIDLLVTPNHNHFVETRVVTGAGSGSREASFSSPNKVEAASLLYTTRRQRMFTAADTPQQGPAPCLKFDKVSFADAEALAAFIGLYIAEGWLSYNQVNICQSSGSKNVGYIDDVCARLGCNVKRSVYGTDNHIIWWTITDSSFHDFVKDNFGSGAASKFVSSEARTWDAKYLRQLIAGYMRGDGEFRTANIEPGNNTTCYNRDKLVTYGNRASTISKNLVDCFAEICVRIGLGFRMTDVKVPSNAKHATQYRFRVDGWNRVILEYPEQHKWEQYNGTVHCVTVANGLLVVRRNGKTAISGNSGMFQSKVVAKTVDAVARGVVGPDPTMDMDHIGLPEHAAWDVYKDFVIRRLSRKGYPLLKATELVKDHAPVAKEMLLEEMADRPVIVDRAPTWHKFNLMGFYPVLTKGDTIKASPLITKGFNLDFDGDQNQGCILTRFVACDTIASINQKLGSDYLETRLMTNKATIPVLSDDSVYMFDLEDLPHGELIAANKGRDQHIDFYEALPGTQVLSMNEAGDFGWAEVSGWSKHNNRVVEIVELASGHQVCTDDDVRAVFGIGKESMAYTRTTPTLAVDNVMVPIAVRCENIGGDLASVNLVNVSDEPRSARLKTELDLNANSGYVFGVICGDGWASTMHGEATAVCVSGVSIEIFDKFDRSFRSFFDGTSPEPYLNCAEATEANGRYGDCSKATYTSLNAASMIKSYCGHKAENKHLPPFYLSANTEFRKGLLAGLMDTDGTISVCKAQVKNRAQIAANICSRSLRMIREVRLLAMSLGIKGTIYSTVTPAGLPFWGISFNAADIIKWNGEGMMAPQKLAALALAPAPNLNSGAHARTDMVPYPASVSAAVKAEMKARGFMKRDRTKDQWTLYVTVDKAAKRGCISRIVALDIIEQGLHKLSVDVEAWERCVKNTDITWSMVTKVEKTGITETGYDLTVPGSETFMSVDGVILSNTMNFHVPVSDKAKEEVKTKMLPSKNLFSTTDLRSPQHTPRMEMTMGAFMLTRPPSKKAVKHYTSFAEAKLAYARGEIQGNDPIEVDE